MDQPRNLDGSGHQGFPFARVLVTGAAGFVGSRVVRRLAARGCTVVALDNLYAGLPLPEARDGVIPIRADIRDEQAMGRAMAHRPDAILHLAAIHHIPTCEAHPRVAFDVNVMGTQTLLDAAAAAEVGAVVIASSGAVYDWTEGPLDEERSPLRARDTYSTTKLTNEYQVATWAARWSARGRLVRLFNVIGPGDPNGHLIPDIVRQIPRDARVATLRLGNVAPRRDYIDVGDAAAGFIALLETAAAGEECEAFNLCTGRELSVADLVVTIGGLLGVETRIVEDSARRRRVDRPQRLGSPAKLAARTGWSPTVPVERSLARILTALGHDVAADGARRAA